MRSALQSDSLFFCFFADIEKCCWSVGVKREVGTRSKNFDKFVVPETVQQAKFKAAVVLLSTNFRPVSSHKHCMIVTHF